MQFREFLIQKEACTLALTWVDDRTAEQAWAECPQADWMLWLAGRVAERVADKTLHRPIVRIALDCARTIPSDDQRVIDCLATVDRWLAGEDVDLAGAAEAAWAAARAAEAAWAAWAAWTVAAACAAGVQDHDLCAIVRKHLPWSVIGPLIERALTEQPNSGTVAE